MLSSDQIYATELLHLGQGLPLWDPEPASAGDEVHIGDVGHIYRGAFHRLFNAMSDPEDAKNNERLLPDPYSKLQLPRADLTLHDPQAITRGPWFSRTITVRDVGASVQVSSYAGSQFELQCSTEQGAFLFLHSDAERSEVMPTRLMEQYMASNYKRWVHLAQERYKRKLDVDDIYFVRGFVKATGWTVVAFQQGYTSLTGQLNVSQGPLGLATSVTWSRQGLRTPEIRQGPRRGLSYDGTPELLIDGTEARPSSSAYQPSRNQCIFLHYYKIKERVLRAPKIIWAAAEPRDLPRDENGDVSPAAVIGSDDQESIDLEDDVPNKIYDPVDDILTYILENSAAELAISSDYEARILYEVYESEDLAGILGSASPAIVVDPLGCGSLAAVTTMPYLERGKIAERPELCTMIRSQIAQRTSAQWSDVTGLSSSAKAVRSEITNEESGESISKNPLKRLLKKFFRPLTPSQPATSSRSTRPLQSDTLPRPANPPPSRIPPLSSPARSPRSTRVRIHPAAPPRSRFARACRSSPARPRRSSPPPSKTHSGATLVYETFDASGKTLDIERDGNVMSTEISPL